MVSSKVLENGIGTGTRLVLRCSRTVRGLFETVCSQKCWSFVVANNRCAGAVSKASHVQFWACIELAS